jgi:SAM-dependent methyltransferase
MRKQYIEVPLPMSCGPLGKLWTGLKGIVLSPLYLGLARANGAPGTGYHLRVARTAVRLMLLGRLSPRACVGYLFFPMDSTRYFEFHEVWNSVKSRAFTRYLDVSSPRFVPLLLLQSSPEATAELINPDAADLAETRALAGALGLNARCAFFNGVLESAECAAESFDLITCISVLEHIPEDARAVRTMWSLLRPGGKLILTVPCMAQPLEQHISHNHYGVLSRGDDGYTFWQRFYDRERLQACIFAVTGEPSSFAVYGEKRRGYFFRNASMKRLLGPRYPFWREPYMMAREYRSFASADELPGEGVVLLEFIKPDEEKKR